MTRKEFIELLSRMDVDDSYTLAYIDFDMDFDTGWANFIKNEQTTKDEDGVSYYEFDLKEVVFDIKACKIIETNVSHEKDYLAL